MSWLDNLLSEKGTVSTTRVMSLLCCINSIAISIVGLCKPTPDYSGLALLCSVFLGAAFGGKVAQKRLEAKGAVIEEQTEK